MQGSPSQGLHPKTLAWSLKTEASFLLPDVESILVLSSPSGSS